MQGLHRAESRLLSVRLKPAIDHQAHPAVIATPGQARHHLILKQTTGLGDGLQMTAAELQIRLGEDGASRAVLNIASEPIEVGGEVVVILAEKLRHPRRLIPLVKAILQGILEGIAGRHQPIGFAPFSADGQQLEHRTHRAIVIEQKTLLGVEVLDPRQAIGEAGVMRIECRVIGQGGARAQWVAPGFPRRSAVARIAGTHYKSS
ncbi:hypothetical protein D3C76_595140 [compost metagenome]